jgi:hypothetical protein
MLYAVKAGTQMGQTWWPILHFVTMMMMMMMMVMIINYTHFNVKHGK